MGESGVFLYSMKEKMVKVPTQGMYVQINKHYIILTSYILIQNGPVSNMIIFIGNIRKYFES